MRTAGLRHNTPLRTRCPDYSPETSVRATHREAQAIKWLVMTTSVASRVNTQQLEFAQCRANFCHPRLAHGRRGGPDPDAEAVRHRAVRRIRVRSAPGHR